MSQSFGEQNITINSTLVGKVRVLNTYAAPAIYPCLGLKLGVTLTEPKVMQGNLPAPKGFQLRELRGELRVAEHGEMIGTVQWSGHRRFVRPDNHESQVSVTCELDDIRVNRIEERRKGEVPMFSLQLWPSLVGPEEWHDAEISAIQLRIPRDTWVEIISKWGPARWSILEVPYAPVNEDRFRRTFVHIGKARRWLDTGEYDSVVGECRLAIDALFADLDLKDKTALASRIISSVPAERAEAYSALMKSLKTLANEPHHGAGRFMRAEATFTLQTVCHAVALVGALEVAKLA